MHYVINKLKSQIEKQKATLLDDEGSLSIESLLSSDKFQSIINNCRSFRSRFYTPFVTLILFIRQVLSPDKSCKNTVATFLASVSTEDNNNIPSSNTGPYCKARQKLPIETLESLVKLAILHHWMCKITYRGSDAYGNQFQQLKNHYVNGSFKK